MNLALFEILDALQTIYYGERNITTRLLLIQKHHEPFDYSVYTAIQFIHSS